MKLPLWPTTAAGSGLYAGWHGGAWTALQAERFGAAVLSSGARAAIRRRLSETGRPGDPGASGGLIGAGGSVLVAAWAAAGDRAFAPLLPDLIRHWRAALLKRRHQDLMLGGAGALLVCSELSVAAPGAVEPGLAREAAAQARAGLEALLAERGKGALLGLAHGLAGYLLALECGNAALGTALPRELRERALDMLEEERVRGPRGVSAWPLRAGGELFAEGWFDHGWCNGAPGIALAALVGRKVGASPRYGSLAKAALAGTFAMRNGNGTLCCGSVGRAHILIEAARLTGELSWLNKARSVAGERPRASSRRTGQRGLFLGRMGRWYLGLRLREPRLPFPGLGAFSA